MKLTKLSVLFFSFIFFTFLASAVVEVTEPNNSIRGVNIITDDVVNNDLGGWVEYSDTQYNNTNRFVISTTQVLFPNNAGANLSQEIPIGVTSYYNGSNILARRSGDGVLIRIRFQADPRFNGVFCEFVNDIGGSVGQLPFRLLTFPKGAGVNTSVTFTNFEYQLDTWKQNGAMIKVECSNQVEFWDIEYTIDLVHRGRGTY